MRTMKRIYSSILIGMLSIYLLGCQNQSEEVSDSYLKESEPEIAEEIVEQLKESEKNVEQTISEKEEVKEETQEESSIAPFVLSSYELQTDINGDGEDDRVCVQDFTLDEPSYTTYTRLTAVVGNDVVTKDYEGAFFSGFDVGDLSGDGKADILLSRHYRGSNYGGAEISVLYYDGSEWQEYPKNFIYNPDITLEQPDRFGDAEYWWDLERYIAAVIFSKDGKPMIRFIALDIEDVNEDTVKVIEASYQEEGWYIEKMEIVSNYYTEDKYKELLEIE